MLLAQRSGCQKIGTRNCSTLDEVQYSSIPQWLASRAKGDTHLKSRSFRIRALSIITSLLAIAPLANAADDVESGSVCAPYLQQTFQQLHSSDSIDLCERAAGKALIVVNTASHCGFTPQFKGLEALYESRKDEGLEIIGIPSDDFNQEADSQAEVAEVCFKNFGVSFMMTEPDHVKGDAANPLHAWLIQNTGQSPRWNFYKYVIAPDGKVIGMFPSRVAPDSAQFRQAVDLALAAEHSQLK